MPSHTVQRSQVKDIQVLAALSINTPIVPLSSQPKLPLSNHGLQTPLQPDIVPQLRRTQSDSVSTASLQDALPSMADPAILSVSFAKLRSQPFIANLQIIWKCSGWQKQRTRFQYRRCHSSPSIGLGSNAILMQGLPCCQQSSRTNLSAFDQGDPSPTSSLPQHRPAPSSHASNSTVGKMSTYSMPMPERRLPHTYTSAAQLQRADSNRQLAKAVLKKKQMRDFESKRFGGADTAGSEADESQINSEAPNIRRKVCLRISFYIAAGRRLIR
jgi:hypothetical protein